MKIIVKILVIIAILVVLVLLIALFVKKDYALEKEIVINKPRAEVFGYIKHIKNQQDYNPWLLMDPGMQQEYHGTDGTEGFMAAWESKKSGGPGKGEQNIRKITENERLDVELHFIKPFESNSPAYFITDSIGADQTSVKWGMSGSMPYPMNFIRVFVSIDKMMGKELEKGLAAMKAHLEK